MSEERNDIPRRDALKLIGTGALPLLARGAGAVDAGGRKPEPVGDDKAAPALVVEGYAGKQSVVAGDELTFHVSTNAGKFAVEIARLGAKREVVWKKDDIAGQAHATPADASSHGCRWPETFKLTIPAEWRSGYYEVRFNLPDNNGGFTRRGTRNAYFIVRSKEPGKHAAILAQLSTNTYNAYNNWGGYSVYAYNGRNKVQGRRVSALRPPDSQHGQWEQHFAAWAENNGYTIDYAANNDLEFHPEILKHYKLVVSLGHDEYWSAPMRDNLEAFIGNGGNAVFFSGNTCCWQIRNEEGGNAFTCWKQAFKDDPLFNDAGQHRVLSSLWSHHLVKRPENELTGVGFLWGGYHRSHDQLMDGSGAFTVHRPEHWIFAGTDLKRGAEFGGKDTIVGYECDGCEIDWRDGLPFPTFRDGTPKNFEILATAPAIWHPDDCEWYEKWEKGRKGNAVIGMYTRGGTVVTVGTTDWSHGLRGNDPSTVRITKNILDRLGKA